LSLIAVSVPATAQLPGISKSLGVRIASPSGDFGDAVESGFGGYFKLEVGALMLGAAAEVNMTRFGGEEGLESSTVFGIQAGPRLGMGLLKLGLDLGWYTEVEKTGYTPNVSLGLGPLEAGAGATFFSGGRWFFLRAGLRF
jgi:hypothetical protein